MTGSRNWGIDGGTMMIFDRNENKEVIASIRTGQYRLH